MPDLSRHTRTIFVAALLAASTLTACGGDDGDSTQPVATTEAPPVTEPATTTEPAATTTEPSATTPKPKAPTAKVYKVGAKPHSVEAGGLKVEVEIDSLVDPVTADVDEPQPGNRFVGVFLNSRASGSYEPSKVSGLASLTTKDGKFYSVRVISGGDCEGSFFPAAFVLKSKKPRTGCIGFDIPKKAVPKEIVLGVRSTTSGKQDTATWALPSEK